MSSTLLSETSHKPVVSSPRHPWKNYTKAIWWLSSTFLAPEVITQQECLLANQIAWLSNLQLILCNQPRSGNWVQQATNQHRSSEATGIPYPLHHIPLRVSAASKPFSSLKHMAGKHINIIMGYLFQPERHYWLCIGRASLGCCLSTSKRKCGTHLGHKWDTN